jgi:hypothetical protein
MQFIERLCCAVTDSVRARGKLAVDVGPILINRVLAPELWARTVGEAIKGASCETQLPS